jgi:hypothetical protein
MTDKLFADQYDQPPDTSTCVTRMPGTSDAPCHCGLDRCEWPFRKECWPELEDEDE